MFFCVEISKNFHYTINCKYNRRDVYYLSSIVCEKRSLKSEKSRFSLGHLGLQAEGKVRVILDMQAVRGTNGGNHVDAGQYALSHDAVH
jgi:hypothetical protein